MSAYNVTREKEKEREREREREREYRLDFHSITFESCLKDVSDEIP